METAVRSAIDGLLVVEQLRNHCRALQFHLHQQSHSLSKSTQWGLSGKPFTHTPTFFSAVFKVSPKAHFRAGGLKMSTPQKKTRSRNQRTYIEIRLHFSMNRKPSQLSQQQNYFITRIYASMGSKALSQEPIVSVNA